MTATLEQTEKQVEQVGGLEKKNRLLTQAVVGLAILTVGLGAWGVWQTVASDEEATTARYDNAQANQ